MTAAVQDRATRIRMGDQIALGVAATTKIYAGTMMQKDAAGHAVPASATVANKTVGIAEAQADNTTGAAGDVIATARRGVVGIFANSSSGDLITIADIENNCYVVDDSTVAKTDNSGARPVAGKIVGVDAQGVHVYFAK